MFTEIKLYENLSGWYGVNAYFTTKILTCTSLWGILSITLRFCHTVCSETRPRAGYRRVIPNPIPAFYTYPHTLDCLIYLDELNDATGPISIVPGTHKRIHDELPHR